jgi:predicted regulator of Ras-like GTPase activity (Roadblock/LC7/MglB family)
MPATPADCVAIPFSMVLPALPPELRDTLSGSGPATGSFVIPLADFEPRLRSGKLRFKWSQLSSWGGNQLSGSPAGDMEVDLPLAPVVPLFLAARQPPDTRKKVEVDSRIPDIFAKSNGAAPEPAPAASPTPAPIAAPAPAARPLRLEQTAPAAAPPQAVTNQSGSVPAEAAKMAGKVAEANQDSPALRPPLSPSSSSETGLAHPPSPTAPSHLLGGPGEGDPGRIIQRIRALAGVAGAFLATADGFLIAGDAPEANASVLAAFAPTVFTQVGKYSGMARLGAPEAVDLHLGSATIHIRKAGKLFLGVLMPHGRPLPLFEIEQISTTLQPHAS